MKFEKTTLAGVFLIDLEPRADVRGSFARLFCEEEFRARGLETRYVQVNNSITTKRGTLRGMHYQLPPSAEVKVVRCVTGALFDVVLDLRPDSPTFGKSFGAELSASNRTMMYVPRGCAHGFLSTSDNAEALYFVSAPYGPADERGLRYDDKAFDIEWPFEPLEVSDKDRSWRDYDVEFHGTDRLKGLL